MRAGRRSMAVVVVAVSLVGPPPTAGEEAPPPSQTPIVDSIEPIVERFVRERLATCRPGVPCFPVTVQVQGRVYSVRESLEDIGPSTGPVPGSLPTHAEMIQHGANPRPAAAGVGMDPKTIVCKTRQLLDKIKGRSRTYYLYRVWDETGERAVLRDTPLDPEAHAASPHFQYLSLGEFGDECAALKAYLHTTHQVRRRRELAEEEEAATETGLELRSGDAPR